MNLVTARNQNHLKQRQKHWKYVKQWSAIFPLSTTSSSESITFFFLLCVQTFLRGVFRIQFGVVKVAGVPALEMQVIRDEGFQKVTGLACLVRDEEQFHKAVVGKLLVQTRIIQLLLRESGQPIIESHESNIHLAEKKGKNTNLTVCLSRQPTKN